METSKNTKIHDMLSAGVGVPLVSKVEALVDNIELNCWKKRKEKAGMVKRERHVVNGKVPPHTSFLIGFIKDLGFPRIILKCVNEASTKALQDAVIHACVGVAVIPEGPLEGDHMVVWNWL